MREWVMHDFVLKKRFDCVSVNERTNEMRGETP